MFIYCFNFFLRARSVIRGEAPALALSDEIATLVLLGVLLAASSKHEKARAFFNRTWVIVVCWVLVVFFTITFLGTPEKYWVFGFMVLIIASYYLPRWYRRKNRVEN